MKELAKRFYQQAQALETEQGWTVTLDGKPIRTPAGSFFTAPQAVIEAAAQEWAAQEQVINPTSMPMTKAVNTALERIAPQREVVIDDITSYGSSDLICYRATAPAALVAAEAAAWDPLLAWSQDVLSAPLLPIAGIIHQPQPAQSLANLRKYVSDQSDLGLSALFELTTLSGSLVIALAVTYGHLNEEQAWAASRVDEIFQAKQWGQDAEAEIKDSIKYNMFRSAVKLQSLLA